MRRRVTNWHNKSIVITGGSAGFGLALATAFGSAGAECVLVARNEERLDAAREQLRMKRIQTQSFVADVTSDQDVAALGEFLRNNVSQLDVLVNAAGKSARARAVATTVEDFKTLWDVNFLSVVRCTKACLPMLQASRGAIINIGSLASKTAGQYLGAYPVAKHSVAAYTQQLRMELAADGVHAMLVCPGPIRRDDSSDRYDIEDTDLPVSARLPGGSRLSGLDPADLAQRVVWACERRRAELVVPMRARLLFALANLWPSLGDRILRRMTS